MIKPEKVFENHIFSNEEIKSIKCGFSFTTILCKSGNVYFSGKRSFTDEEDEFQKSQEFDDCVFCFEKIELPPKVKICSICCGKFHQLFLTTNGKVYGYGSGNRGQLGDISITFVPILIEGLPKIRSIHCSAFGSYFIDFSGIVHVLGFSTSLGIGCVNTIISEPNQIFLKNEKIIDIFSNCGAFHVFLKAESGKYYCCGGGTEGQLGNGKLDDIVFPEKVYFNFGIKELSVAGWNTLVLSDSGKCYSFGFNGGSRCGHNIDDTIIKTPKMIETLKNEKIIKIKAGWFNLFFWNEKDEMFCCGVLGWNESIPVYAKIPVKVKMSVSVKTLDTGEMHVVLLTKKNHLVIVGSNKYGQVGIENKERNTKFNSIMYFSKGKDRILRNKMFCTCSFRDICVKCN